MGIPLYFKTLSSKFPETIVSDLNSVLKNPTKRNHLFFDLNCAIHPCCRNILKEHNSKKVADSVLEKRMLTEISSYMKKIIDLVEPTTTFIAIDGVAPFSKMNQQRERRYKSFLNKGIDDQVRNEMGMDIPNFWDTNAISPGTKFMTDLYHRIIKEINENNLMDTNNTTTKIIFSSANDPGEGEHKILKYIRENFSNNDDGGGGSGNDNIIVYGLDADLIMLSMSSGKSNIYLLREALAFNKIIKDKFLLLDIDYLKYALILTLRENIIEYDSCYTIKDVNRIIDDYIFLCYFLGNDFLPHMPGISLKDGGHELLLNTYISILVNYQEYLVDKSKMRINNTFLFSFINKLTSKENDIYQKYNKSRNRLRPSKISTNDPYELRNNIINNLPITDNLNKKKERQINLGYDKYKSNYYKICFDIETVEEIDEVCENYLRGMNWVFNYYFKGCISWGWKYNYRHPPLISSLRDYLDKNNFNINTIKYGTSKPLHPINQLLYILPKQSINLIPPQYRKLMHNNYFYPDHFSLDMIFKRYFWQTQPILPDMTYKNTRIMFQKIKLNTELKKQFDSKAYYEICPNHH